MQRLRAGESALPMITALGTAEAMVSNKNYIKLLELYKLVVMGTEQNV